MWWWGAALAAVVSALTGAATPAALRSCSPDASPAPESSPSPAPPDAAGDGPPDYAALVGPRFVLAVVVTSLLAGLLAFTRTPPPAWLAWAALVGPGALCIVVDAATTWIPRALSLAMDAVAAIGIAVWAVAAHDPWVAVRAAAAGLLAGGFFLLFRLASRGQLGLFDVRLAAVVGAVTGAGSAQAALWSVFAGTAIGAIWGVLHALTRGRTPFAYGPALWLGPFAVLLLGLLLPAG